MLNISDNKNNPMVKTIKKLASEAPVKFWSILILSIAVIGYGGFLLFLNPVLQNELGLKTKGTQPDSYPLILQKDIHLGIESILKKVVGVGRYEISVVANVEYEKTVKSSISYESDQPEQAATVAPTNFDLPGIFDDGPVSTSEDSETTSELPGFDDLFGTVPSSTQKSSLGDSAKKVNLNSSNQVSAPPGKSGFTQVKEYTQKDYQINGFLISVVIDGNYFSPTDQAIVDLKSLVQHLGVINPRRGDKLEIRVIEFSDLSSDSTFVIKMLKSIVFNPILLSLLVVGILAFIAFKFVSNSKQAKELARLAEEKEAELQQAQTEKNTEAERLKTEQAYQELLSTFDNTPDVTANILSDWMEGGDSGSSTETADDKE